MIHKIVVISMINNIVVHAKHIPGRFHIIADYISRLQMKKLLQSALWIPKEKTQIPESFLPWQTRYPRWRWLLCQKALWRTWNDYLAFIGDLELRNYENPGYVLLFLHDLASKGCSPSTVTSKLSCINYVFNLMGLEDLTKEPFVKRYLMGLRKLKPSKDVREPVTIKM